MLAAWNSFYVMTGSAAAALTGLMFVVITLITDDKRRQSEAGVSTFSTPTVIHFSCALFVSAIMAAPFTSLRPIVIILSLAGAGGIYHVVCVALRTAKLQTYRPDAEDWTWHVILPLAAYAAIAGGAILMRTGPERALFAPAAGVTLLIFIGIHNAWDVVTFLATGQADQVPDEPAQRSDSTSSKS
jgi:hypothetical protein